MKKVLEIVLFCIFTFLFCMSGKAQVTVGSLVDPEKGALLDLKNHASAADSTTATSGGLLLPRVRLVDRSTLEPFIGKGDAEWNQSNQKKTKVNHIGLTVYNLTNDSYFHAGLYIWGGSEWKSLAATSAGYIFLPSFNVPWTTNGSINLFNDVYKVNFNPSDKKNCFSSMQGNPLVALPDYHGNANDFHYVVTYYDPNVIKIDGITSDGVMTYSKMGNSPVPPGDAYINVVMIRK
jgi:hypothetical protein